MYFTEGLVYFTTYQGSILGPIARVLGKILEGIYFVLSKVGIENTGLCIILFTFLINAVMIPLQIKQQKFTKMSSVMNPEITAIQNKYKGKTDQESQRLMNYEMQAVYQKYGVSPASGCLPMLITFPIIFALYRVIYNIPAYVPQIYDIYEGLANNIIDAGATVESLKEYITVNTYVVTNAVKGAANDPTNVNYFIDILSQFTPTTFKKLAEDYPRLASQIDIVSSDVKHINSFLGLNIADTPRLKSVSVLIPLVSLITQFISQKLTTVNTNNDKSSGGAGAAETTQATMKAMTNVMPFVSAAMCFMFPIGVGIYWIAGNIFRIIQSLAINLYFDKHDYDKEMSNNIEKSKKRMAMMGLDEKKINEITSSKNTSNKNASNNKNVNTEDKKEKKSISSYSSSVNNSGNKKKKANNVSTEESVDKADSSSESSKDSSASKGSIASYANYMSKDKK
ncbi:MAG: YidC/Oxa1 family membrane protein insertase [Lachnospiraceae bacterium]|nr:YidC/Oxa1 family membrane protein insertase [Lachnospiraceae bacterium]